MNYIEKRKKTKGWRLHAEAAIELGVVPAIIVVLPRGAARACSVVEAARPDVLVVVVEDDERCARR